MYQKILVPTDGSATAAIGVREGISLAKHHRARIRLVHVVDELPAVVPTFGATLASVVIDGLRDAGLSILKDAETLAREAGVPADTKLIEEMGGQTGAQIVLEAESWAADLIVCGTHGRRGIRRVVMGSDAEYVVRHSSVPVLLVPARAAAA